MRVRHLHNFPIQLHCITLTCFFAPFLDGELQFVDHFLSPMWACQVQLELRYAVCAIDGAALEYVQVVEGSHCVVVVCVVEGERLYRGLNRHGAARGY